MHILFMYTYCVHLVYHTRQNFSKGRLAGSRSLEYLPKMGIYHQFQFVSNVTSCAGSDQPVHFSFHHPFLLTIFSAPSTVLMKPNKMKKKITSFLKMQEFMYVYIIYVYSHTHSICCVHLQSNLHKAKRWITPPLKPTEEADQPSVPVHFRGYTHIHVRSRPLSSPPVTTHHSSQPVLENSRPDSSSKLPRTRTRDSKTRTRPVHPRTQSETRHESYKNGAI